MPLDEHGAKWSCEPCVRGHRSSKCQHFDRLMMKVPKAGRPLAKCPHPKGTCSCQKLYAFMVRIPKGNSCICRPVYHVPQMVTETGKPPQPTTSLPGPVSPSVAGPNRVQKRTKRQSSVQATPNNVAKGLESLNNTPNDFTTKDITQTRRQSAADLQNMQSMYSPQYQNPIYPQIPFQNSPVTKQEPDLVMSPVKVQDPDKEVVTKSEPGSCCSSKPVLQQTSTTGSSCCGGTANKQRGGLRVETGGGSKVEHGFPHTQTLANAGYRTFGDHRSFSSSDLQTQNRTYNHSLPYGPQESKQHNLYYSNSMSAPATGYSSPHIPQRQQNILAQRQLSQPFPLNPVEPPQSTQSVTKGSPRDICDCGDGCQCLGCAAHPYNDTTRQHIQEMGYMMALEHGQYDQYANEQSGVFYDSQTPLTNLEYPTFPTNGLALNETIHDTSQDLTTGRIPKLNDPSFSNVTTFSDPNYNQAMMQPNAYYTLEYPVGLMGTCTNLVGTCQCGADCSCVGCLTHSGHNGVSLEPSPPPEELTPTDPIAQTSTPQTMQYPIFTQQPLDSNEFAFAYPNRLSVEPPPV
ncbi:hypothetical protein AJ80_04773 [Polytolypa hystricis UAMH7299]|uniref:Copper-fist domain-containing protein n=1 Tax=Polytolypa hystricis (strain UAMH7299) TaxID=1447883 RepID=A0A2B7Y0K2_POLH7|nr:hypothetical protein AJ80_04773 [Polytolypa hystricis UAMH7299]